MAFRIMVAPGVSRRREPASRANDRTWRRRGTFLPFAHFAPIRDAAHRTMASIGDAALDRALTCTVWRERLLGTNDKPAYAFHTVLWAMANNASVQGDTTRRVIPIRLVLGFIETYKRLTGKTPPPALLAAETRRQAVEREPLPQEELADAKQHALEPKILAMEAPVFQTEVCNGRKVCEVNQTQNREWGEVRTNFAHGYVNLKEGGAVALQVRDRRARDWSNDQYKQVVVNSNLGWTYHSPRRSVAFSLKVAVYEVDLGDVYHFTMAW